MAGLEALEASLPKPSKNPARYATARVLEALLESILALRFLEAGYTRNAAGKAFQAWRALTGALLALNLDAVTSRLKGEEGRWLRGEGLARVPTTRLKALARLLEEAGIRDYSFYTDRALLLHDYQCHGPDPDLELSKYRSRGEAVHDTLQLLEKLIETIEAHAKPKLSDAGGWSMELEEALNKAKQVLGGWLRR